MSQALNLEFVRADKVRNPENGQIFGTEVFYDDFEGKPVLIVDDICDGGYTFLKLAEKLKEKNAGMVILYVTHGIFSKGLDELCQVVNNIITTDSLMINDWIFDERVRRILL